MSWVLAVSAAGEAVTGVFLLVLPQIVVRLLFAADIAGAGIVVCRIAGISLIALGIACWPGADASRTNNMAYGGMLTYSALTSVYLATVGLAGVLRGPLLWPAAVVHLLLTVALAIAWSTARARRESRAPIAK